MLTWRDIIDELGGPALFLGLIWLFGTVGGIILFFLMV